MSGKYLIGLDVGGGGGRCLLINVETGKVTSVFRPWRFPSAPEIGMFAYSMDLAYVWRILGEATQEALKQTGISPREVAGIAATGMRFASVVLDKKGGILMAAPNRDARAAEQGMRLAVERGEELYQATGHAPGPIFTAARLLWLKETDPDAFRAAHAALSFSDWVGFMLSGQIASDPAQAGESLLLDLKSRRWAGEVVKSLGLVGKILPSLKHCGSRLGKLSKEAAANLGLSPGIPVAVGGPDTPSGLLGAGVIAKGQIGVIAGSTTPVQMVLDELVLDPEMRTWTGLHVIPGLYLLESNAGQMGATLEWFARLVHPAAANPVGLLVAEASTSIPGAHGILSTIGATVFNAAVMEPPVDSLSFSSVSARLGEEGRGDVARAILEGMAYAVRANVEQLLRVSAGTSTRLWLSGGLTRSALWTQMVSDVMACPVSVSGNAEATALGAAICAGVGAGIFPDLLAGAQTLAIPSREHQPGEDSAVYQSLYAEWQSLRQERQPSDGTAASLFTQAMMADHTTSSESKAASAATFQPHIYIGAEVDEASLRALRSIGEVTYKPYRTEGILLTGDELVQTLKNYHVFVTEVDIVDAEALLKLPDLRMIIACRGNPVNIDLEACTLAGIPVTNTPARNADAVADLAVGLMLMLARKLQPASAFLHQPGGEAGDMGRMGQAHEEFLGFELWHKTIGIVGGGAIGSKVIQRALPFGARLLLCDPFISVEQALRMGAEKVSHEQLLAESDFISLHAPVTDETRNMLSTAAFERLKPGAFLVNTARAALVDKEALLVALRSGGLGGYAADVFDIEPPAANDPLLSLPNVIATPHIAGNTREVATHQGEIIVSELQRLLEGKQPVNLLNPAALEIFSWSGARKRDMVGLKQRQAAPGPGVTDIDVSAQKQKSVLAVEARPIPPAPGSLVGTPDDVVESPEARAAREKITEILKEFTSQITTDKELNNFARGKNVVFLFTVKDMDISFYMSFVDGKADAGLGSPSREPDVRLKMVADILDGMFTGRVNATRAATSGKLSFSGDTGKAMAFMRIQGNITRLYSQAREKIGDPGDLSKLAVQPVAASAPLPDAPAQPAPTYLPAVPVVARTGDIRDQILLVTSELYAQGLITGTGGNVSARCDDNPNEIWITPTAIFKGELSQEMMVRLDLDGKIISETDYTASSERRVHCAIYKLRADISAVIHSHAPNATMMALTGTKFLPISTEAAFIGDLPVVPFIMPGTDELGVKVAQAIGMTGIAAIMQNHGLVVAGSSLRRAADTTDVIETTAHKLLTCKMLGTPPAVIPDDVVTTLREVGKMMG
jgi:sugar (pentulose or hexulose) kinase/phosphoglycerate dehydrogenase-like enzyme/ribulose-5-phosphate 4-epimerase/fuculose-1-phosphate aldolase/putative sterol carrier protein